MRIAPVAAPSAAHASLKDLVGTTLVRAVYANDGGVERDVRATWLTSDRTRYSSIEAAVRGAQLLQKAQPSKDWDFAIAVVKDPAREGYGLLQLDSSLVEFDTTGNWFQATSFRSYAAGVEAVVNGMYQPLRSDGMVPPKA
jgi:hypothetical protein